MLLSTDPDNEFDGPLTPMGATVAVIPNHVDKSQTPGKYRIHTHTKMHVGLSDPNVYFIIKF